MTEQKESEFLHCKVVDNLEEFMEISDVIVANRVSESLMAVRSKVYTRDLFHND